MPVSWIQCGCSFTMLSYMLPMEEKAASSPTNNNTATTNTTTSTTATTMNRNFNLSLNLNGSPPGGALRNGNTLDVIDETTNLLASERCDNDDEDNNKGTEEQNPLLDASQREDSFGSDASKKIKMSKLQTPATKSVALKR